MNAQLPHYSSFINYINVEGAVKILDCSFHLSEEEKFIMIELISRYKSLGEASYKQIKDFMSDLKKSCETDWLNYMTGHYEFSQWNSRILDLLVKQPPSKRRDQLVHTICRLGEFFYLSDKEMEEVSQDLNLFIETGDCKLFDDDCPYGPGTLNNTLEEDIREKEGNIREFIRKTNQSQGNEDLPDIKADDILKALQIIRRWNDLPLDQVPEYVRGYIQLSHEIKEGYRYLDHCFDDGFQLDLMMSKLSGSCLNKERKFREFRELTKTAAWKNPETCGFIGDTKIPIPKTLIKGTIKVPWWNMDAIYYSIGKGPWLKTRYLGQPTSFWQNTCEPGADWVKRCIKKHYNNYCHQTGPIKYYNIDAVNIYRNDQLKDFISTVDDTISLDFSSYSDYLSRNTFKWIMKNWWGFPEWYSELIMSIMALPVRINGKDYPYAYASVMGVKINFLLITFSNLLMWMVYTIIQGVQDKVLLRGDDRITGVRGHYQQADMGAQISVSMYFNCISNTSKCEWMLRDGYGSFCKVFYNRNKEDISGLGGEYILKSKPFLQDVSNWITECSHRDIAIRQEDIQNWMLFWLPWIEAAYYKFHRNGDPDLEDMIKTQRKVSYQYGGLSLNEADEAMDQIMLRSLLSTINSIMEDVDKDRTNPARSRIRGWLKANFGENSIYYQITMLATGIDKDWDYIREAIECINKALNSTVTFEDLKQARSMAQRLSEIVLQRDSRLANSTSTKNRIDYSFDQDKISKIRKKYLDAALSDQEFYDEANLIDNSVFNDLSEDGKPGIIKYLEYRRKKAQCQCYLTMYFNYTCGFLAMAVHREGRILYKRIDSEDSDYRRGDMFVTYDDLTSEEKEVFNYYRLPKTRKIIETIEHSTNKVKEEMRDYLISYLTDLYC